MRLKQKPSLFMFSMFYLQSHRDTVSSIGIVRGKSLPLVDSCDHICYFRHALALDECRVKFMPECIFKDEQNGKQDRKEREEGRVKEVWFPGSHSDV